MMNPDDQMRAALEEHWQASERGDTEVEHAIYSADGILDYPQSGERFRGRDAISAQRGAHPADRHFTVLRISRRRETVGERVHHHLRRGTQLLGEHHGIRGWVTWCTRRSTSPTPSVRLIGGGRSQSQCRAGSSPEPDLGRGNRLPRILARQS